MNPIERKIRQAGGTVLSEPLLQEDGEINPKLADQLFVVLAEDDIGGSCSLAKPGRGDCEHFIGYPSTIHIPGRHDGLDDTSDAYGKPNGWCWSCWKSYQIKKLRAENLELKWSVEESLRRAVNFAEWGWTIIANAGGSDWEKESKDWQIAAGRYRDEFHTEIRVLLNPESPDSRISIHEPPRGNTMTNFGN